jgi:hypothetical protein
LEQHIEPAALQYPSDVYSSGISWGAAIAGAFVIAALSLILLALGAGFGLSVVSPWSSVNASSASGGGAVVWLIITAALSSAMGGYLAGRLRTRWVALHTDEVHFRDTANGLVAWAVGLVVAAAFLASSAASMVGGTIPGEASNLAAGSAWLDSQHAVVSNAYYIDRLLRPERPIDPVTQVEATRVFDHAVRARDAASAEDIAYLAELVSARTAMGREAAEAQVSQSINEARASHDEMRKNIAHILLWTFVALLVGALCASYAATIGGRQRDHVRAVS